MLQAAKRKNKDLGKCEFTILRLRVTTLVGDSFCLELFKSFEHTLIETFIVGYVKEIMRIRFDLDSEQSSIMSSRRKQANLVRVAQGEEDNTVISKLNPKSIDQPLNKEIAKSGQ